MIPTKMDVQQRSAHGFFIYPLSEYAITLEFNQQIQADTIQKIRRLNDWLHRHPFEGFRTTVPAYATLTIYYDLLTVIQSPRLTGITGFERVSNYLDKIDAVGETAITPKNPIVIPVCYGGDFGPDLGEVAQLHGITEAAVIEAHQAVTYQVYLIGFTPGFTYLGGMPKELATPRKKVPRKAVPAGSVGIAGEQTGVYPLKTPGGWQLIGRTPLRLFDTNNAPPARLQAGDQVVFQPITVKEFNHDKQHANTHR